MFLKQNKKERKKNDKNQIIVGILTFLIFLWTIGSIFGFIAYGKTKKSASNVITASAETLQEFSLRQYVIEIPALNGLMFKENDGLTNVGDFAYLLGTMQLVLGDGEAYLFYQGASNNIIIPLNNPASSYLLDSFANVVYSTGYGVKISGITSSFYSLTNIPNLFLNYSEIDLTTRIQCTANSNNLRYALTVTCNIEGSSSPVQYVVNFNISADSITADNYVNSVIGQKNFTANQVIYTITEEAQGMSLGTFAYYYNAYLNAIGNGNAQYNLGYTNGYTTGKADGTQIGYENGFGAGREQGFANGRAQGYQEGIDDSNQYTFFNLITAVVDAPIQAFTGLFNFDILGVNLASFFLGLLTVGVCLAVLRLVF